MSQQRFQDTAAPQCDDADADQRRVRGEFCGFPLDLANPARRLRRPLHPRAERLGVGHAGGTLIDAAFSYTAPGISSAREWAEVGGGIRLPAWNNGAVTASVTASIAPNQTTTYVSCLGVVQAYWGRVEMTRCASARRRAHHRVRRSELAQMPVGSRNDVERPQRTEDRSYVGKGVVRYAW